MSRLLANFLQINSLSQFRVNEYSKAPRGNQIYIYSQRPMACNIFTCYLISTFVLYPRKRSYQISRCYNQNEGRIDLKMSPTSMLGMSIVFVCCICTNDGAFDLEENHNLINLINGLMKLDQMLSTREATYLVCTKTQRPL